MSLRGLSNELNEQVSDWSMCGVDIDPFSVNEVLDRVQLQESIYREKVRLGLKPVLVPRQLSLIELAAAITSRGGWNISFQESLKKGKVLYSRETMGSHYWQGRSFTTRHNAFIGYGLMLALVDPFIHMGDGSRLRGRHKIEQGAALSQDEFALNPGSPIIGPAYMYEAHLWPEVFLASLYHLTVTNRGKSLLELIQRGHHSGISFESVRLSKRGLPHLRHEDPESDTKIIADISWPHVAFSEFPVGEKLDALTEPRAALLF